MLHYMIVRSTFSDKAKPCRKEGTENLWSSQDS